MRLNNLKRGRKRKKEKERMEVKKARQVDGKIKEHKPF